MQNAEAEAIAEDLLVRTGKAMMDGDADTFLSCFTLPQMMETTTGRHLVTSLAELHCIYRNMVAFLDRSGVMEMHRTIVAAEFRDADMIVSTHVARLISRNGYPRRSPFPVQSVLRRMEQHWKIASSIYVILDSDEHNEALMPHRSMRPVKQFEA